MTKNKEKKQEEELNYGELIFLLILLIYFIVFNIVFWGFYVNASVEDECDSINTYPQNCESIENRYTRNVWGMEVVCDENGSITIGTFIIYAVLTPIRLPFAWIINFSTSIFETKIF